MTEARTLRGLFKELASGSISRRVFIERSVAFGISAPVAKLLLTNQSCLALSLDENGATPSPEVAPTARPNAGTTGQQRGAGGELKLLQWQAPVVLGVHNTGGLKDTVAASLVTEPLMNFLPDGSLVPTLITEVPSKANGLLSNDLTKVTYRLVDGIVWSDGTALTSNDVVFTWRWVTDPHNEATTITPYQEILSVEAVDRLTVQVTLKHPWLGWYLPFTSSNGGGIYPEHVLSAGDDAAQAFRLKPIGTGPYVVDSFTPGDQAIFSMNTKYREVGKPFFSKVNLKGGGDAASAAQGVLQVGEWDIADLLQVEPTILAAMEKNGKGKVVVVPGGRVEHVLFNFSDPNKTVNGERSQWQTPHPILSDRAVRQAMSLSVDRASIAKNLYLPGENPTANILDGIPALESKNTSWNFDLKAAAAALDEAGWITNGDGVRAKNGVEIKLTYATTILPVRQKIQQLNKQNWAKIGIEVILREVDSSVFLDSAATNDLTSQHFYYDLDEYASGPQEPIPTSFMGVWYSNQGKNIAQKSNGWTGINDSRYNNPEYDRLYEALLVEIDPAKAADIFVELNDILIKDFAVIPMVQRAYDVYAVSNRIRNENIAHNEFECLTWNVANWNVNV